LGLVAGWSTSPVVALRADLPADLAADLPEDLRAALALGAWLALPFRLDWLTLVAAFLAVCLSAAWPLASDATSEAASVSGMDVASDSGVDLVSECSASGSEIGSPEVRAFSRRNAS
jgi:hypothetical protein